MIAQGVVLLAAVCSSAAMKAKASTPLQGADAVIVGIRSISILPTDDMDADGVRP